MFVKRIIKNIFNKLVYIIYKLDYVIYKNNNAPFNETPVDHENRNIPQSVFDYEQFYDRQYGGYRDRSDKKKISYASVEVEVGRFLYSFVNMVGANYILETGTNKGYSTAMLAAALKNGSSNGKVYTMDISAHRYLFQRTRLDNIEVIIKNSLEHDFDPDIIFDILVLDSDHSYFTVINELIKYEKCLREGGYILMHDSLFYDGVGMAVEQLMTNPRFEVITLESPRTHGVAASRCPGMTVVKKISGSNLFPLVYNEELKSVEINAFDGEDSCSESYINKIRKRKFS
jgi:predicted O-methyltransferase YrrM